MSIASKLLTVAAAKQSIKDALIGKGEDMSAVPFTDYGTKVANLAAGSGGANTTSARVVKLAGPANAGDVVVELENVIAAGTLELVTGGWLNKGIDTQYSISTEHRIGTAITPDGSILLLIDVQQTSSTLQRYEWNGTLGLYELVGGSAAPIAKPYGLKAISISDDGAHVALIVIDYPYLQSLSWTGSAYAADPFPTSTISTQGSNLDMSGDGSRLMISWSSPPYLSWFYWDNDRYVRGPAVIGDNPASWCDYNFSGNIQLSGDGTRARASTWRQTPFTFAWNGTTFAQVGALPVIDATDFPTSGSATVGQSMSKDGTRLLLLFDADFTPSPLFRFYVWSDVDQAFVRGNNPLMTSTLSTTQRPMVRMSPDGSRVWIKNHIEPYLIGLRWSDRTQRYEEYTEVTALFPQEDNTGIGVKFGNMAGVYANDTPGNYMAIYRRTEFIAERRGILLPALSGIPTNPKSVGWLDAGGVADDEVNMTAIWWAD